MIGKSFSRKFHPKKSSTRTGAAEAVLVADRLFHSSAKWHRKIFRKFPALVFGGEEIFFLITFPCSRLLRRFGSRRRKGRKKKPEDAARVSNEKF
jgi:hypothetical protein